MEVKWILAAILFKELAKSIFLAFLVGFCCLVYGKMEEHLFTNNTLGLERHSGFTSTKFISPPEFHTVEHLPFSIQHNSKQHQSGTPVVNGGASSVAAAATPPSSPHSSPTFTASSSAMNGGDRRSAKEEDHVKSPSSSSSSHGSTSPPSNSSSPHHPLFSHGVCRWTGCETPLEGAAEFRRHLEREHVLNDRSTAQTRVQVQIVSQLKLQLKKEEDRLEAMMRHLHPKETEQQQQQGSNSSNHHHGQHPRHHDAAPPAKSRRKRSPQGRAGGGGGGNGASGLQIDAIFGGLGTIPVPPVPSAEHRHSVHPPPPPPPPLAPHLPTAPAAPPPPPHHHPHFSNGVAENGGGGGPVRGRPSGKGASNKIPLPLYLEGTSPPPPPAASRSVNGGGGGGRAGLDPEDEISRNRDFYRTQDVRPPFTYAALIRQVCTQLFIESSQGAIWESGFSPR